MAWHIIIPAIISTGKIVYDIISDSADRKSYEEATAIKSDSNKAAFEAEQARYEELKTLLNPFIEAGTKAQYQQDALSGALGEEAKAKAYADIEQGSAFKTTVQQGENAILQNASATGGLRGGNTQGALAQFRPQILNELVNQRFSQLQGTINTGLSAAGGLASSGYGGNIADSIIRQGQIDADAATYRTNTGQDIMNNVSELTGYYQGLGGNQPQTEIPKITDGEIGFYEGVV